MRRKNILISSTIAHNFGDNIIAYGVYRLLREIGIKLTQHNIVVYNRNPDLQLEEQGRAPRLDCVGNYDNAVIGNYDAIILAGSPECFGPMLRPVYEHVVKNKTPLFIIGAGNSSAHMTLSDDEREALNLPTTVVTYRQQSLRSAFEAPVLPCPALFCTDLVLPEFRPSRTTYVIQRPHPTPRHRPWHTIHPSYLVGLEPQDRKVVIDYRELIAYPDATLVYSPENFEKEVEGTKTISTRLHGAIAALASGTPAVVVGKGDYRIEAAAKEFVRILPVADSIKSAKNMQVPSYEEIKAFKLNTLEEYKKVLAKVKEIWETL